MPNVGNILERKGRDVAKIDEDASVLDAAQVMNQRHIGALVVVRADKVVGIFTERDVLNRVVVQQRSPAETRVRDVMTTPVTVCSEATTRAECRSVMKNRRVRHLPVVEQGRLAGIVSIGDILEDEGVEQAETIRSLYEYMYQAR
jgi:CBS domain-containing protein